MAKVVVSPYLRGVPGGGNNGDVLVRDDLADSGYSWSSSVAVASDRIASSPMEVIAIGGSVGSSKLSVRVNGVEKMAVTDTAVTTTVNVNGRNMSTDGSKLDGIETGAQKNPTRVTSQEKTSPGSVTSIRSYSPSDVKEMIDTHSSAGAIPAQVTSSEIANSSSITDLRSYSPADVHATVTTFATGEANPTRVTSGELANPSAATTVRSFSPSDVYSITGKRALRLSSQEYALDTNGQATFTWSHTGSRSPDVVQVYAVCISSEYGYSVGDQVTPVPNQSTMTVCKNASGSSMYVEGQIYIHKKNNAGTVQANGSNWKVKIEAIWIS